jgi:hypothetical protein
MRDIIARGFAFSRSKALEYVGMPFLAEKIRSRVVTRAFSSVVFSQIEV